MRASVAGWMTWWARGISERLAAEGILRFERIIGVVERSVYGVLAKVVGVVLWDYGEWTVVWGTLFLVGLIVYTWDWVVGWRDEARFRAAGCVNADGVAPVVLRREEGYWLIRARGVAADDFKDRVRRRRLEQAFGVRIVDAVELPRGLIRLVVGTERIPEFLRYEALIGYLERLSERAGMRVALVFGASPVGLLTRDLADLPHLLIAGETGSGKSSLLRFLLVQLVGFLRVEVSVIDLKGGVEFSGFERWVRVASTLEEGVKLLEEMNEELDRRLSMLKRLGVVRLEDVPWGPRRVVLVIDEVADLLAEAKGLTEHNRLVGSARFLLGRLARLGRAAGIHLVVATQRPTTDVIDGQIRENLPARVVFHIKSDAGSIAVLGDGQATELPTSVKGRCLWDWGTERMEVQVPWISHEIALRVLGGLRGDGAPRSPRGEAAPMSR